MTDWYVAGVAFVVFLVVLITGLAVAVWALAHPVTPRRDARSILDDSKLDFELRADGAKRAEGSLQVDTPGRYPFTCDIPGHAEAGMRGTLVVQPAG
jgi:plastocyanin